MWIKAIYCGEECLLNDAYIVDIFNTDKLFADAYILDFDRDGYKIPQSEVQKLLAEGEI